MKAPGGQGLRHSRNGEGRLWNGERDGGRAAKGHRVHDQRLAAQAIPVLKKQQEVQLLSYQFEIHEKNKYTLL